MANKINVKLILELVASGVSQNTIVKSRHISKKSVTDVVKISKQRQIFYSDIKEKSDDEVYRLFYPDKFAVETMFKQPDYTNVHGELKKVGVTLKLLHQEYTDLCMKECSVPVGYTKFTEDYRSYIQASNLTNHLEHKPGQAVEVDWAGKHMEFIVPETGELVKVYFFVACLPFSQFSYVEPTLDMKQDTWLRCHIHMFEFFGGVPVKTVCDNLKTGVIKHPREGDIVLNDAYEALGSHYVTAIMPAGVRKPKHKPSVEGAVGRIANSIMAKLRNHAFSSLVELKIEVAKALHDFNNASFQKRDFSRKIVFNTEELVSLRHLPSVPYEVANWIYNHKVYPNSHVCIAKNFYSVPYAFVGQSVDIRLTDTIVEIYNRNQRISSHVRFPDYVSNRYDTIPDDMPDAFNQPEMNDVRLRHWASSIGKNASDVVERIFASVTIKEQAYNSVLSVLKLSKKYSIERFETACEIALSLTRTPRYKHLNSILSSNQDLVYLESKKSGQKTSTKPNESSAYVRGPEYYGGGRYDK